MYLSLQFFCETTFIEALTLEVASSRTPFPCCAVWTYVWKPKFGCRLLNESGKQVFLQSATNLHPPIFLVRGVLSASLSFLLDDTLVPSKPGSQVVSKGAWTLNHLNATGHTLAILSLFAFRMTQCFELRSLLMTSVVYLTTVVTLQCLPAPALSV